jgi:hypothetical protein
MGEADGLRSLVDLWRGGDGELEGLDPTEAVAPAGRGPDAGC